MPMLIEDITIDVFEKAWFKEEYSLLSKDKFEIAYSEYIDVSGLFRSKMFDALASINYLSNRISSISIQIAVQRNLVEVLGEPFEEGLSFFKKYNHFVVWKNDRKQFLDYLSKIESKEQRYILELKKKQREFEDDLKRKKHEAKTLTQTRHEFISMINQLRKKGYIIDKKTTTVEELALIIKEVKDEPKPIRNRI